VLYVGLLTPRKGVLDLMEASRLLRARGVDHELCLLGGTPDEGPEAEAQVRAGLDDHVRLLGTRPPEEMPAAFAEAEVFCLPSWWEAMPLSILEAMAAGLPVVATDVGDVGRAVQDGVTGYVVPAKDPQGLATALEALLTDADRRRRMGAAGRERVLTSFSADVTAGEVSALYAELGAA
jgi:glycosyltransferase involved in cell wall biosynthesis